jgi:hypothetical protein
MGNHEENSLFVSIHFNDGQRATASGDGNVLCGPIGWAGRVFLVVVVLAATAAAPLAAKSESSRAFYPSGLVERTRALNRGIKSKQFYVIANVRHPAAWWRRVHYEQIRRDETDDDGISSQIATAISDGVQRHWEADRRDEPTLTLADARPE